MTIHIPDSLTEDEAKAALDAALRLKASNEAHHPGMLSLAQDVGRKQGATAAIALLVESKMITAGMRDAMVAAVLEKAGLMFDKDPTP